mmetsp:Transcript_3264/g.6520  ORF Transcript_3264/g.6520 Transcript_3264/m.6520 type:complete len:275 (-) Transcript_3264:313-1137(-)
MGARDVCSSENGERPAPTTQVICAGPMGGLSSTVMGAVRGLLPQRLLPTVSHVSELEERSGPPTGVDGVELAFFFPTGAAEADPRLSSSSVLGAARLGGPNTKPEDRLEVPAFATAAHEVFFSSAQASPELASVDDEPAETVGLWEVAARMGLTMWFFLATEAHRAPPSNSSPSSDRADGHSGGNSGTNSTASGFKLKLESGVPGTNAIALGFKPSNCSCNWSTSPSLAAAGGKAQSASGTNADFSELGTAACPLPGATGPEVGVKYVQPSTPT